MNVAVIGGSGHIGSYLTPALVEAGFDTICVSRSQRRPYVDHAAWSQVRHETLDRAQPDFDQRIAEICADAVIDLTCYTPEAAVSLVQALQGNATRLLHCGTIWIHGVPTEVPVREEQSRNTFGDYGLRKAAIEEYLMGQTDVPVTILHPGHLVGEGWIPLNPAANFNPRVFADLASGRTVTLPNLGRETVHHVHAADVAQCFVRALQHWPQAAGQSFHVVSPAALTLIGYAETVASWYGQQARLECRPWEEWRAGVTEKEARTTWDHISRSPNCSIEKARRLLGYEPRYSSLDAVREALFSPLFPHELTAGSQNPARPQ